MPKKALALAGPDDLLANELQPQPEPQVDAPPPPVKKASRHELGERFADPDLVDRIFDYVVALIPELRQAEIEPTKAAIRKEFGGAEQYVRSESVDRRKREMEREVRRMFDGRNASQIARVLNISRATVYRCLKQPGPPDEL